MKSKFKIERKSILVLAGIFVVLFVIGCFRNLRTGIFVGDKFFYEREEGYYVSGDNEIRMIQGDGFTNFQIVLLEEVRNAGLTWSEEKSSYGVEQDYATITFENGTVVEGTWFGEMLIGEDGLPLDWGIAIYTDMQDQVRISDEALGEVLCRLDLGMTIKNGSTAFLLLGGLIYLIGAVTFLYPEKVYFFGTRWRYKNAELSDDGIMMQMFSAVVMMIMAAVIMMNPALIR